MIATFELLTLEDCQKIKLELEKFKFIDGKTSASGYAKDLKENFQLESTRSDSAYIFNGIKKVLLDHPYIRDNIFPQNFPRMFANYYSGGHRYDWHVDMAFMTGMRTDYSFTISLTDPESYEGGTLELELDDGSIQECRLAPGHMIIYPTGVLHRVTQVTSGNRLSIVGWIQSTVSDTEDRALFAEFIQLMTFTKEKFDPHWSDMNRFNKFKQKFYRRILK